MIITQLYRNIVGGVTIKILLIDSLVNYGGVSTHLTNLANTLSELDCSVTLLVPNSQIYVERIHSNVQLIEYDKCELEKTFTPLFLNQFDVVNSSAYVEVNTYLVNLKKRNFKLIITIHEVMKQTSLAPGSAYSTYYQMLKQSDCLVTVSLAARKMLLCNGFSQIRIETIGNGVAIPNSKFNLGRRDGIAYIGRLSKEKNILALLQAMKWIRQADAKIRLNIYGEGPMKNKMEQYILKHGLEETCILKGFQKDIDRILQEHKMVVLPSLTESCSYTLLEAMAAGTYAIASSCPGNKELIIDGVVGSIVPCNKPKSLAESIKYWYYEDAEREGVIENAYYRVEKLYSREKMSKDFLALYKDMIQ